MDEGDDEENRNVRGRSEAGDQPKRRRAHRIPDFPAKDSRGTQDVSVTKDQLQAYLNGILHIRSLRNHKETAKFLQVCRLSFIENLGRKFKEGEAHKRPGGRLDYNSIGRLLHERFTPNCTRWFILRNSYLAYLHPGTDRVREVMLFDNAFDTEVHVAPDANADHGLSIKNHGRILLVQFKAEQEARSWKEEIDKVVSNEGKEWRQVQQFGSTYPPRPSTYAQWFVYGSSYFEHAAHMMEMVREEIFIVGWWVTPEIFLKRPPQRHNDRYALLALLKRKAQEGVHVFILLYQEYDKLLYNGSLHAEKTFMDLHPNIVVGRHPSQTIPTPWSHHEKVLVVDQCVAFAGGIDLYFGRWNTHEHKMCGGGQKESKSTKNPPKQAPAPDAPLPAAGCGGVDPLQSPKSSPDASGSGYAVAKVQKKTTTATADNKTNFMTDQQIGVYGEKTPSPRKITNAADPTPTKNTVKPKVAAKKLVAVRNRVNSVNQRSKSAPDASCSGYAAANACKMTTTVAADDKKNFMTDQQIGVYGIKTPSPRKITNAADPTPTKNTVKPKVAAKKLVAVRNRVNSVNQRSKSAPDASGSGYAVADARKMTTTVAADDKKKSPKATTTTAAASLRVEPDPPSLPTISAEDPPATPIKSIKSTKVAADTKRTNG